MSELDNPETYSKFDPTNLLKNVQELPSQCEQAWEEIKKVVLPSYYVKVNKVIVLGMGGSAIGGDLVRALLQNQSKTPIFTVRDYDLPAFVDRDSLVIASSYSGNTEEALEAFSQAIAKKSKSVAITTGGKLADLATAHKIPLYKFDYKTEPRQALGFSFAAILGILNKIALIDIKDTNFRESILLAKALNSKIRPEIVTSQNQAKKLAEELRNKIVVILAGGHLKPVAQRFKTQLNENSKQMAFWEELPEACHNFIIGLEFPNKLFENVFALSLFSNFAHPRIKARQNIILEILDKNKILYEELRIESATSMLSDMLLFILLLDYTSYYLALLNKIDPRPIKNINYLKKKLEELPWQK
jgi:glucose/mannose-6-phosphate isomerase